jgi:hypothetical protein
VNRGPPSAAVHSRSSKDSFFSVSAIAVLILVGMLLPAHSHLIGAYAGLRRSVSKIIGARPQSVAGVVPAITGSYVAAIIGGVVLAVFLDPVRLWRESRIGVFEIAAAGIVCILAIVILFLVRKVQTLQQILVAAASPLERTLVDDPRTGVIDRAPNDGSRPAPAWDPGAIKEAFKRKQHEFDV